MGTARMCNKPRGSGGTVTPDKTMTAALISVVLVLVMAPDGGVGFHIVPAYIPPSAPTNETYEAVLAMLAMNGLANRDAPTLWLNASSTSWVEGVAVMWSYPAADATWIPHWAKRLGESADVLPNADLCTVFGVPAVAAAVKGVVLYEASAEIDALRWVAATAAGLYDAVPMTTLLRASNPCFAQLPVALQLPSAASFATDLDAYQWMVDHLLRTNGTTPSPQPPVLVGACRSWKNYTCAWSDPLGTAAIDYAVATRGIVVNLAASDPDQAQMLRQIGSFLPAFGVVSGWMEPEDVMVDVLSQCGLVVQCGAPNLPFFAAAGGNGSSAPSLRLPHHRMTTSFDRTKTYVAFQSNEGDTPKNAYSFRQGNWLNPARGSVPIAWGVAPLIAELFPGLWEYYVDTATPMDSFFAATGGVGYTHPWSFRNLTELGNKAGELIGRYMPSADNLVDVWEGACPSAQPRTNADLHAMLVPGATRDPCTPLYQHFRDATGQRVNAFSQQPTSPLTAAFPDWVDRAWTMDGTPVMQQPSSLWYPVDKGVCNKTAPTACIESHIRAAAFGPSRFVLAYGVPSYVDVAADVQHRLAKDGIVVVGAQDIAALAVAGGPRGVL
eukprot:m.211122 g.211122  ORF g.211122 m.211122 type:complete len:610 (+) comp25378_c0_seq1:200-2029(+)